MIISHHITTTVTKWLSAHDGLTSLCCWSGWINIVKFETFSLRVSVGSLFAAQCNGCIGLRERRHDHYCRCWRWLAASWFAPHGNGDNGVEEGAAFKTTMTRYKCRRHMTTSMLLMQTGWPPPTGTNLAWRLPPSLMWISFETFSNIHVHRKYTPKTNFKKAKRAGRLLYMNWISLTNWG